MATSTERTPRIAVTLSPASLELVTEISKVSGKTKASIISELMDDILPVLQGQFEAQKKLAARPEEARQHVQDVIDQGRAVIDQQELALGKPRRKYRTRKGAARGAT